MVLSQFAFKTMLGCRLPLPGWRARGRVSLCQPFYCAYRLYAHMQRHCALDGPTDAEQTLSSCRRLTTAQGSLSPSVPWRTLRRVDWTVKRVVCPGARTLPPARLQSAVVKTAFVAQTEEAHRLQAHRVRQVYSRAASQGGSKCCWPPAVTQRTVYHGAS